MSEDVAILQLPNGNNIELPVYHPSIGLDVVDVRTLGKAGYFTFDPGFMATGSCESKITFIDGEKGILLYRGYSIDELAAHSDFMEVSYLLLKGELPSTTQKTDFLAEINNHTMVHEQLSHFYNGFRRDAHPHGQVPTEKQYLKLYRQMGLHRKNPPVEQLMWMRFVHGQHGA